MAKRLTDSEKWRDPWFKRLDGKFQLFWLFCLDTCDHAGVWKDQLDDFVHITGFDITLDEILAQFKGRIFFVRDGIYFIPKFIDFQYPNFNPTKNNAHLGVIRALQYFRIDFNAPLKEGLPRGWVAPQDKEQEQDKDKDKEQEQEKEIAHSALSFSNATPFTAEEFFKGLDMGSCSTIGT